MKPHGGGCTIDQATGLVASGGLRDSIVTVAGDLALWAWDNQGGSTMTQGVKGVEFYFPASGSIDFRNLVLAAPTPPYTLTLGMSILTQEANYKTIMAGWKAGLGGAQKLEVYTLDNRTSMSFRYMHLATETGGVPAEGDLLTYLFTHGMYWKLQDTGTLIKASMSYDGVQFMEMVSHVYASPAGYLDTGGYNYLCFGGNAEHASQSVWMNMFYYDLS
jgi:hypothetical protein